MTQPTDDELTTALREAQPSWINDGKGIRGDAKTLISLTANLSFDAAKIQAVDDPSQISQPKPEPPDDPALTPQRAGDIPTIICVDNGDGTFTTWKAVLRGEKISVYTP